MADAVRSVGYGRPGTRVIPEGWQQALAPVAQGTMTATVALRKPGTTPEWSDEQQATVPVPHAPYAADVPARIQAQVAQERPVEAAGETLHVRGYLVTLPFATDGVLEGDLVDVTGCDDPDLVDRTLTITDVLRGTQRVERDVFCTLSN